MNSPVEFPLETPSRAVCYLHAERCYVGSCPLVEDGSRLAFPGEANPVNPTPIELALALHKALDHSRAIVIHPRPSLGLLLRKSRMGFSWANDLAAYIASGGPVQAINGLLPQDASDEHVLKGLVERLEKRGDLNAVQRDAVARLRQGMNSTRDHSAALNPGEGLERSMEPWLLAENVGAEDRSEFLRNATGVVVEQVAYGYVLIPISRSAKLVKRPWLNDWTAPQRRPQFRKGRLVDFKLDAGTQDEAFGRAVLQTLRGRKVTEPL